SQGRLLASVIPGVQTQVMERDTRGRVTRIHSLGFDGKQQRTIEQTHDSLNRMTHVIDRSAAAPQLLTELYYDQIKDPEGTLHEMAGALLGSRTYDAKAKLDTFDVFQRDLKNRVVLEKTLYLKADGTIVQRSEEARTWRADDQEVQLQINGELTVNYEYERAGGLKEVRASLPGMEAWKVFSEAQWAPHRQITQARLAQGAIGSAWGYDENYLWNEARDLCLAGSGSSVDNPCATGESLENDSLERYSNGYVQSRNDSHTYTYSKRGELTGARQPRLQEQWNYTAASHFQNFDGRTVQASGRSPLLPATGAERTLELDEWGRVTEFAGVRGFYNAEDRLVRTEKGRESIEYGYHAHGLRSFKRMRSAEGEESTLYFPNTHLILGTQRQVTLKLPGQLVAEIDLNRKSMSLILTDGVGTPLKRFDAEGQLIESWERGAFGQLIQHHAAADGSTTLLSFGGHNEDAETSWIHMGQRIYIPSLGHFATPDPLFMADPERCISGSWQECELYTYVANNPVNFNDPDGLAKGSGSASQSSKPSHASSGSSSKASKPSKASPTKQVPKALPALKGPGDYHIFRTGGNSATALTPRPQDTTGLSFSMVRPEGQSFHVTTIVTVNGTGHLTAVNDHGTHVSVSAAAGHEAMASWIASRPTATTNPHPLTVVLMSITEFHRR
ncbi:MAG: RHS repeat-associated core domain-containing protein, partial [Pseudobdellovibrionaceae bacterium]|nr:RHS repeat-associated core domain-containing protein [Pseudobdellovibrionaceae bacterium]